MDVLDKRLHPQGFQEYNLSRSILQEPHCLWSHDAAEETGAQFHNGLLASSDGRMLVACGVDKLVWICVDEAFTHETPLPAAESWPRSSSLVGENAVALRRGAELHIVSAAGAVQEVQLPGEDPGDLLAASVDGTGTVSLLFVNKVPAGRPLYGLTLGRVGPIDFSKQGEEEAMPLTIFWRLFGSTPPLGASITGNEGTEALILSHGRFDFERPSLGADAEEQRRDDVDELDEELGEILRRQGLQLPKSQGASAVVTLALASSACEHYHLSLPAVTCRVHSSLPPGVSMAVVLRTAQGHGAICQCWVEPQAEPSTGASRIKVRHCATFPGLAVLCATPGMAYLSLDALDGKWAALGKWWSGEAVEVFRHPKGRGSSSTQGLQLDGLQGLQLLGHQLFVWHSRGLLRYNLPPEESWSEIPGRDDHDEWGQAPCADLSDLENAWQQSS